VGSNGSVEVEYSKGGTPIILVPDDILEASGLCRVAGDSSTSDVSNGGRLRINVPIAVTFLGVLLLLIM
jgi:alpha-amylase